MRIRVDGTWTRTPRYLEATRREIEKQSGRGEIPADRVNELRPTYTEHGELIFDAKRIRTVEEYADGRRNVRIWTGTLAKSREQNLSNGHDHCAILPKCEFQAVPCLVWLQVGGHDFWWNPGRYWHGYGLPKDFQHAGRKEYRNRQCYVLNNAGKITLYVGVNDRRLHGLMRRARDHRGGELRPRFEFYLDDYREVAPGFWLPWEHGYTTFEWEDGDVYASADRALKIVEVQTNPKLADELFEIEFPEGVRTTDWRYNPPLIYKYKKDRSEAEMAEILAKSEADQALAKEIKRQQDERMAKLIGHPAADFPEMKWLNGESLSWKNLAGQVVILEFFAEWCGPCRNDLPLMSELHAQRETSGIAVIGVHTPDDELETVSKFLKEFKLAYPVCIDVEPESKGTSFGQLSAWYGVRGIPHSVLIDAKGNVAAHGTLRDVVAKRTSWQQTRRNEKEFLRGG